MRKLDPDLISDIIDAKQYMPDIMLAINDCINAGDMVGIMVDRVRGSEQSMECILFDGKTVLPAGPWLLAAMLNVPIVACFGLYCGGNKYQIHFETIPLKTVTRRREREQAIAQAIQTYCQRIEYYLSLQPYNWFNFYDFWNDDTFSH